MCVEGGQVSVLRASGGASRLPAVSGSCSFVCVLVCVYLLTCMCACVLAYVCETVCVCANVRGDDRTCLGGWVVVVAPFLCVLGL